MATCSSSAAPVTFAIGPCSRSRTSGSSFAAVQVSWISYAPLYLSEVVGLSALGAGAVLALAQAGGILGRSGPNYGEDTKRVLSSVLGMTAEQVAELRAAGVV